MAEFLKKFESIINVIIDFVVAIVKAEFPEIADVLVGTKEEEIA